MKKTNKLKREKVTQDVKKFLADADLTQLINALEILTEQLRVREERKRIHLFLYHKETVAKKVDEISKVRDAHAALDLYEALRPLDFQLEDTILNKPAMKSDQLSESGLDAKSYWKEKIKKAQLIVLPCRPPINSPEDNLERVRRSCSWLESQLLDAIEADFVEKSSREQVILAARVAEMVRKSPVPIGWITKEWRAWLNIQFFQQQREYAEIHGFPAIEWEDAPDENQTELRKLKNTTAGYLLFTPQVSKDCDIALLNVFGLKGNDTMILARLIRNKHAELLREVVATGKKRVIVFKMQVDGLTNPGILEESCCLGDIAERWVTSVVFDVALE